jgi:hypothetical protein
MDTKGEGISRDQTMVKRLGESSDLLEVLPQQTEVESPLTDNRKFIPTRKKRGGCNGSSSGGNGGNDGGDDGDGGGGTLRCGKEHDCEEGATCNLPPHNLDRNHRCEKCKREF